MEKNSTLLLSIVAALIAIATLATKLTEYRIARMKHKAESAALAAEARPSVPYNARLSRWTFSFVLALLQLFFGLFALGFLLYLSRYGPTTPPTYRDVAGLAL